MGSKQNWSITEGIFNCLIDEHRTLAFQKAINNTVLDGDIVVDMGTGSGILAMFAADAGAKRVYAIELDARNFQSLKNTFELNGYKEKIVLIKADARNVCLPEKVDVIITEMIATGLIEELQIPAMNNILRFARRGVRVVLKSLENYVDLTFNKDEYFSHKLKIIRYEYPDIKSLKATPMTTKVMYKKVDFSNINRNNKITLKTEQMALRDGKINGLRISSKTIFNDGMTFDSSFAYCYPVILPVQDMAVKKGDRCLVSLSYKMCEGFNNLRYAVSKV